MADVVLLTQPVTEVRKRTFPEALREVDRGLLEEWSFF